MGVLYGRDTELERVAALLDRAHAGHGGALVLVGEPGIGKTALVDAAVARATGFRVAAATMVEAEADLPFAGLGELAGPFLDHLPELPAPQAAAVAAALALGPPSPASGDRLAVFRGFATLFARAARDGPLLVAVDDAHWLDASSADCLAFVARRLGDRPIALLAARRPAEPGRGLRLRVRREEELAVGALDRPSSEALLGAAAGDLARPAAEAVLALAAGNPLALRELPPLLPDAQRRGLAPVEPPPAPAGALRDAFERRLARVSPAARAALVVAAASSERTVAPVLAACAALGLAGGALEEAESAGLVALAADRLAFTHPLLRAVALDAAPPADRRRANAALARATDGDARAWHLAAAAVGPDEEAAQALEEAGVRAMLRGAHHTAADAFERSAGASADADGRGRRTLAAGLAAGLGGAYARAAAILAPVAASATGELGARIRHVLALVTLTGGGRLALDNSAMLAAEAERIAAADPALAALLDADAALAAVVAARCDRALACAERAAATLPETAPDDVRCHVLAALGMTRALRGRVAEARDALDAAGRLLPALDPLSPSAQSTTFALHARVSTGQHRALRDEVLHLGSAGRDTGSVGLLTYDLLVAADAAYRLGDWAPAERYAAEAVATADESDQLGPLSVALVVRARLAAARGDEAAARAGLDRALAVAAPHGYVSTELWARAALGFVALTAGRTAEAIAELERTEALVAAAALVEPVIVPYAPDLVEAYARAGRDADAARASAQLAVRADATGLPLAGALAARCAGIVAPDDGFAAAFERSLVLHADADTPFERARTLLAYGARLHRARRRVEARERLREARAVFADLGARPWADRAAAELRAAGAVDRAPAGDPDALTAQELRVARLAAGGATNREVAAELFLSPKTVEFHLGRVYRKLGVRSRVELAALHAEGGLGDALTRSGSTRRSSAA